MPGVGRDTTVRVALRALRLDSAVGKASRLKVKATRRANVPAQGEAAQAVQAKKKKGGRR